MDSQSGLTKQTHRLGKKFKVSNQTQVGTWTISYTGNGIQFNRQKEWSKGKERVKNTHEETLEVSFKSKDDLATKEGKTET